MAAGKLKFDLTVFLESVGAEHCTQDLLRHGVDSLHKLATLTRDKFREWNDYFLSRAITKAQRLVRSSDAVVQEELLVSDTNLILEKKDWGLSISVGQAIKRDWGQTTTCEGVGCTCSTARCVLCYPVCVCTKGCVFGQICFCVCLCVCDQKTSAYMLTCQMSS